MVGNHPRNTESMRNSLRCGAKTRAGTPCRAPAVTGKKRCRMHGGTAGSGAPIGNQNAYFNGLYTQEALAEQRRLQMLMRNVRETLKRIR